MVKKCRTLTDLFLKSSAASASTSANTASTNAGDIAEPTHLGERHDREEYEPEQEQNEEDEEVDVDNCMTVRHVFIMALMIYWFVLCIGVVHCSDAGVYSVGIYVRHHWGYQQMRDLYVRQKLLPAHWRAAGGRKGRFMFPVCHKLKVFMFGQFLFTSIIQCILRLKLWPRCVAASH